MTQDQYGQARGPGYVVRGDVVPDDVVPDHVVPDDETAEFPDEQEKPMTRFQKVASALRGSDPDRDEQDSPVSGEAHPRRDYWEDQATPDAERDEAVAVSSPDAADDAVDHPATQPDMFGTATHAGNGATPAGDEMRPGEADAALGDFGDLTYGNLIPDVAQYTDQWQQIQYKFVDDPRASVTEAADIIAQVTAKMEAAIQERQRAIEARQRAIAEQQRSLRDRWGEGTNADTEALRATLRMYKTFLDQLIGPQAG